MSEIVCLYIRAVSQLSVFGCRGSNPFTVCPRDQGDWLEVVLFKI